MNVEELRLIARRLPAFVFEYIEGGAEDELTLKANRDTYARICLRPRTLANVANLTPNLLDMAGQTPGFGQD